MFDSLVDIVRAQIEGGAGSGGGGGNTVTGAAVDTELDQFEPDGSGTLALAFGQHLVAGQLLQQDYSEGPPAVNKLAIGLGEGEWEGPVKVFWAGTELSVSPDASTAGYRFHPGSLSSGLGDAVQGVDAFFSGGLTYNSTAYVALRLTEGQSSEKVTDKHRGIYECKLVPDYSHAGIQTDAGSYSTNPARLIAWAAEQAGAVDRIDWVSWTRLKEYCDETISWDDGTSTRNIARFEAHPVWTGPVDFSTFLDAVCLLCCATWQDDSTFIRFLLPTDQQAIHHFELGVNSGTADFKPTPPDLRTRINKAVFRFRDLDDEDLQPVSVTVERPALQEQYGEVVQEIAIANCNQSQARRVGEYWMRLTTDNPNRAQLSGFSDSYHVLPGDYVTVTANMIGWNQQLCRVTEAADLSTATNADKRNFTVQAIDGAVYRDSDQQPRQVQE